MIVSASTVKDLRIKTGVGMMDCKKALIETNGDFEAAIDFLKTKGLTAAKKLIRATNEGVIAINITNTNKAGVIVEVNSETDFVVRNQLFQDLVKKISTVAINCNNIDELKKYQINHNHSINDLVLACISQTGENIIINRMSKLKINNNSEGIISSYIHNNYNNSMGKIGVLVALESTGDKSQLKLLGKEIAMHIAATNPEYLNSNDIPLKIIEREKNIFIEQAKKLKKPTPIMEKLVEGKIKKLYEEIVLLEQISIIDGKTKIQTVIDNASKKLNKPIKISNYIRFAIS